MISPTQSSPPSLVQQRAKAEIESRQRARTKLLRFSEFTNQGYRAAAFHAVVAAAVDKVLEGKTKRLLIAAPPRHGKTELVTRKAPALAFGQIPRLSWISASYGKDLAMGFGREVRNLVAGARYRALFPDTVLAPDSQAKDQWNTNHGGGFLAVGVNSAITGFGANILNIDDPVKDRAEAESETVRKATWDWYRATAYPRLEPLRGGQWSDPSGAIIVTATRWHEEDLTGRLIEAERNGTGDQWEKLIFPAIDPITKQALWPESYDLDALQRIRGVIGEYDWAALYDQMPRPAGGSFFNIEHLLVAGRAVRAPLHCDAVFATIDSATKTGKQNDGTGVLYWALNKTALLPGADPAIIGHPLTVLGWDLVQIEGALLEAWLPGVFRQLEEHARNCGARAGNIGAWVEDKSSGMILLQQAQHRGMNANAIESGLTAMGKVERAIDVSGYVNRGLVKLSEQAYDQTTVYKGVSRNHLTSQVLSLRIGSKDTGDDDLLDCFTYGIALAIGNAEGF